MEVLVAIFDLNRDPQLDVDQNIEKLIKDQNFISECIKLSLYKCEYYLIETLKSERFRLACMNNHSQHKHKEV